LRAFYGMRNGRVVHVEAIRTADRDEQRRLARSRLDDFDCVEIWDGPVLCIRIHREGVQAELFEFKPSAVLIDPQAGKDISSAA
jgi:hypothetical protein